MNLIPSIIVLIIASLVALPLLGVPIFSLLGDSLKGVGVGGGGGYDAPSSGYGGYGAPSTDYGAPSSGYGAPPPPPHLLLPWVVVNVILLLVASILALSLSIPNPTLPNAPSRGHGRSDIAFYEQSIADLQQQVANLQGSTNYSSPVGDAAQDINGVGYSS